MYTFKWIAITVVVSSAIGYMWAVHILPIIENPAPKDEYGQLITLSGSRHSADRSNIIGEH